MDEGNTEHASSSSSSNTSADNTNSASTTTPVPPVNNFTDAFNSGAFNDSTNNTNDDTDDDDDDEEEDMLPPGMSSGAPLPPDPIPDPTTVPGAAAGGSTVFHPLANLRAMDTRLQTIHETAATRPITPPELKKEEIDSDEEDMPDTGPADNDPSDDAPVEVPIEADDNSAAPVEQQQSAPQPAPSDINGGLEDVDDNSLLNNLSGVSADSEDCVSRKRPDEMALKDELDYEEGDDKESGEEGEIGEMSLTQEPEEKEEGEISDEEESSSLLQNEPKTVCRFFNKGQCTWGTNCRFLHPGVSDKGNYNMFAPGGAAKEGTDNKENEGEKDGDDATKKDKKEKTTVGGRPRFIPELDPFESAWERGLRHAKDLIKRSHKRREMDADFEEKRFNLSLGQAELDRENDYYTRPASPVLKVIPQDPADFDPYDERQAIRHFRGGYFENFEVRYHVGPGGPPGGAREHHLGAPPHPGSPHKVPPVTVERDGVARAKKKYPEESRYPRSPDSKSGGDSPKPAGGEDWADPWARRGDTLKKGSERKPRKARSRSYSSGSRSSRSSSGSSRSSGSRSDSSRSYSRSASRSGSNSPRRRHRSASGSPYDGARRPPPPQEGDSFYPPNEVHYPPQQYFRGGGPPPNFRGRGGGPPMHGGGPPHYGGGMDQGAFRYGNQGYFRGRGGRGFPRGNFRGRYPYNHYNNQGPPGGPPGGNYPPQHGGNNYPHGGPPGRGGPGRPRRPSDDGRQPPRDPRRPVLPPHNHLNIPPHHPPPSFVQGDERAGGRSRRSSDPRLKSQDHPQEKVDAFGRMIRQPKRDSRRSRSVSRSRSRSGSSSSRSITPPQKRRRRKYSLSASRSRSGSRSYSRSVSRSVSRSRSRSHSSDSDSDAGKRVGARAIKSRPMASLKPSKAGLPTDPRINLPPTSIGFEARNNTLNSRGRAAHPGRQSRGGTRMRRHSSSRSRSGSRSASRSVSGSRSRSYSSSSSSSSSDSSMRRRRIRNPDDRPRVPINTLAAYTAGGGGSSARYAQPKAAAIDANKVGGQKQQIKLSLKPSMKPNTLLQNDDDDSGESDTGGANALGKRKATSPAPAAGPVKKAARVDAAGPPAPAPAAAATAKKSTQSRREELLMQLRAVEDAIAKKRNKLNN